MKEAVIIQRLKNIQSMGLSGVKQLEFSVKRTYEMFWFDPVTPMEFFEMLGTEGAKVLNDHFLAQQFLATQIEDYVFLTVPEKYNPPEIHDD